MSASRTLYFCCRPQQPPSRVLRDGCSNKSYLAPRQRVPFFETDDTLLKVIQSYLQDKDTILLKQAYYWWRYELTMYFTQLQAYREEINRYVAYEQFLLRQSKRHHTTYFREEYKRLKCRKHKPSSNKYYIRWGRMVDSMWCVDEPRGYERTPAAKLQRRTCKARITQALVRVRE